MSTNVVVAEVSQVGPRAYAGVVLTERVDHLIWNGQQHDAPGMGTFEVKGDKITAHRDYFGSGDGPATYGGTTTRAV